MLQKKPSALKRGYPTLQNMNFFNFFYFCGSFLPSWIRIRIPNPDPGTLTRLNPDPIGIRIRIRNPGYLPYSWSAAGKAGSMKFVAIVAACKLKDEAMLFSYTFATKIKKYKNKKHLNSWFLIKILIYDDWSKWFRFEGTQDWEFFWLRFWILCCFIVSYAQMLRFCKKHFLIKPLLGEIQLFRVVWD